MLEFLSLRRPFWWPFPHSLSSFLGILPVIASFVPHTPTWDFVLFFHPLHSVKFNNFSIKNTLHFYLDSFYDCWYYWEKAIEPSRPRFCLFTLQGYLFIMFEILWHHVCLFTTCWLTYWVSSCWFPGRVCMGSAPGLSQTDRRVQILALQVSDHVNCLRRVSKPQRPHRSSGVVARRPTWGFARTREFNEMVTHMQCSAQCLPHSTRLLPWRF